MAAQDQAVPGGGRRGIERLGVQLALEELVGEPLIDDDLAAGRRAAQQHARVVRLPPRTIRAEVAAEGLLAPRYRHRVGDRRERRYRVVARGIAQRDDERAVTAHRV